MSESVAFVAPRPGSLDLGADPAGRRMVLEGPPQTAGMRAGVVVLAPGGAVGRHSTGGREEVIVVLEGRGEVRVDDAAPMAIAVGSGAYVPPGREHDVVNGGTGPLRYLYVVAPVAAEGGRR